VFGTEKEAAQAAGVSVSTVYEALKKGGRTVKGRMIAETPPVPTKEELMALGMRLFTPGDRKALLRFPPGEAPLCRGLHRCT
jgi:hypothetical protein